MNIVTTTSVFPPCYPPKLALSRLKACGFRHLDLAFDYLVQEDDFPFVTDAWEAWAHDLADFAKKNGYPLLDLYKLIYPDRYKLVLRDGVHLSPAGHTFFAEEVEKCLKNRPRSISKLIELFKISFFNNSSSLNKSEELGL